MDNRRLKMGDLPRMKGKLMEPKAGTKKPAPVMLFEKRICALGMFQDAVVILRLWLPSNHPEAHIISWRGRPYLRKLRMVP